MPTIRMGHGHSFALAEGGYIWWSRKGWIRMDWQHDAPCQFGPFACFGRCVAFVPELEP